MQIHNHNLTVEVDGTGPAVLLVHGLGGTTNYYKVLADELRDRFTVIRVDSAGAGRSDVVQDLSVAHHAEDLVAVLDALEIDTAALVGHSMGTLVVREVAARFPQRVSKMALLGAVAAPGPDAQKAQQDRAALVRREGTGGVAAAVVANALSPQTHENQPLVAAFVQELVAGQDPEGYARNCEALAGASNPGPVSADLPLLLITGDADKVGPPQTSHDLAAGHPDARVEILTGVGHWTALEAADDVYGQLAAFL